MDPPHPEGARPSPSGVSPPTNPGPSTGYFQIPVCTVRSCQPTSLGRPTLTETRVATASRLPGLVAGADKHFVDRHPSVPSDDVGDRVRHVLRQEWLNALHLHACGG